MDTAYIVVKALPSKSGLMYFAGTALGGSAPRWSSDYADVVMFASARQAQRISRSWGGTIHEVDA